MSLTFLMVSCFFGEMKSAMFSMAELNSSMAKTKPIAKITAHHSRLLILRSAEQASAVIAATTCILALCSSAIAVFSPLAAYMKLFSRFLIENDWDFMC